MFNSNASYTINLYNLITSPSETLDGIALGTLKTSRLKKKIKD